MNTDEQLAQHIQQRDRDSMAELVRRHHHALIGFVYRMTGGDRALAEDLAQETFLRMMRAINQYQYPRPFKAWLYAIATNLVRDYFKRAEQRYQIVDVNDTDLPAATHIESNLVATEGAQALINALMHMPETHRAVIVLRYYQELSLNDIAEALDIPLGTVKSRLSVGLGKLKVLIEKDFS